MSNIFDKTDKISKSVKSVITIFECQYCCNPALCHGKISSVQPLDNLLSKAYWFSMALRWIKMLIQLQIFTWNISLRLLIYPTSLLEVHFTLKIPNFKLSSAIIITLAHLHSHKTAPFCLVFHNFPHFLARLFAFQGALLPR